MNKLIVVTGNPDSGFSHYGPFDTEDQAVSWADLSLNHETWWVIKLLEPLNYREIDSE